MTCVKIKSTTAKNGNLITANNETADKILPNYRVYRKEVNSLKNDTKLKSMKYLVKILFYLD